MKKRILFVDDQPRTRQELTTSLADLGNEWEPIHSASSTEALALLARSRFEAVVADLRLPVVTGAQFLDEVMQRHPHIIRIIMSDLADNLSVMKCIGTAHQFLRKPCDVQTLRTALNRAESLDVWLPNEKVSRLLAQMHKLPSPPQLYFQVVKELQSDNASLDRVGALIAQDPAMTAKVLQLVNSTVFGLPQIIVSPTEAVLLLGVEATNSMILLAHSYSYYQSVEAADFSLDELCQHSLRTATFARCIADAELADETLRKEAYTGGMLHDIGKLVLATNLPKLYREVHQLVESRHIALWEAEQEVFGATHAELGACLLAIWALPITIVETLALHHLPARLVSQGFSALTTVHVANAIEHAQSSGSSELAVDRDYLAGLGLEDRLPVWQEACRAADQNP
jgi:HD-like signal output (HDOD) protein